jgi:hypothetical protein
LSTPDPVLYQIFDAERIGMNAPGRVLRHHTQFDIRGRDDPDSLTAAGLAAAASPPLPAMEASQSMSASCTSWVTGIGASR